MRITPSYKATVLEFIGCCERSISDIQPTANLTLKMPAKDLGNPEVLAKIDRLRELNVGSLIQLPQVMAPIQMDDQPLTAN